MKHSHDEIVTPEMEALNQAVDQLMQEKRLKGTVPLEFRLAVKLKTSHQTPQLRPAFDQKVKTSLLWNFADAPVQMPFWKVILASTFTGVALVAVLAFAVFYPPAVDPTQNIAAVQDFEPLSRAEVLLGQLPIDARTVDGFWVRDIRLKLHEINEVWQSPDTHLDPSLEAFPHIELRNTALDLITMESDLVNQIPELSRNTVLQSDIFLFSEKVEGWPKQNEGVSFEVHAKAVNAYLNHQKIWDMASYDLAEGILEELTTTD